MLDYTDEQLHRLAMRLWTILVKLPLTEEEQVVIKHAIHIIDHVGSQCTDTVNVPRGTFKI